MSSHDPLLETLRTQLGRVLKPDIERLFDEAYQEAFTEGKALLKERILAAILDGSSSLLEGLSQLAPAAPAAPDQPTAASSPAPSGTPPLPEPPPMPQAPAEMEAYPTTMLKVEQQTPAPSEPRPAVAPPGTPPSAAHPLASAPPTHT